MATMDDDLTHQADGDSDDEENDHISDLCWECIGLFERCCSLAAFQVNDWFEEQQAEFNWWTQSLKADRTGHSSLDYRLRNRPDIANVVTELINGISTALDECLRGDKLDVPSGEQGRGRELSGPFYYIRTNLDLLTSLSVAIIRSGTKLRYGRADAALKIASPRYDPLRRHLAALLIPPSGLAAPASRREEVTAQDVAPQSSPDVIGAWLDGSRLTRVQRAMIDAVIVRHNRICYARAPWRIPTDAQSEPKLRLTASTVAGAVAASTPTSIHRPSTNSPVLARQSPRTTAASSQPSVAWRPRAPRTAASLSILASSMPATDIGSSFTLAAPMEPEKAVRDITVNTGIGLGLEYPPRPLIDSNAKGFKCPFCSQTLPREYLDTKTRWRTHVAYDLLPYTCIFEACESSTEFFRTSERWLSHMKKEHGTTRWVCETCMTDSPMATSVAFNSVAQWEHHMLTHDPHVSAKRLALMADMSLRRMLDPVECPLCHDSSELEPRDLEKDDHAAWHLHSFALEAIPWEGNGEYDPVDLGPDGESQDPHGLDWELRVGPGAKAVPAASSRYHSGLDPDDVPTTHVAKSRAQSPASKGLSEIAVLSFNTISVPVNFELWIEDWKKKVALHGPWSEGDGGFHAQPQDTPLENTSKVASDGSTALIPSISGYEELDELLEGNVRIMLESSFWPKESSVGNQGLSGFDFVVPLCGLKFKVDITLEIIEPSNSHELWSLPGPQIHTGSPLRRSLLTAKKEIQLEDESQTQLANILLEWAASKTNAEVLQPLHMFVISNTEWRVDNFLPLESIFLTKFYAALGPEYPRRGRSADRQGYRARLKHLHFISTSPGSPLDELSDIFGQSLARFDVEGLRDIITFDRCESGTIVDALIKYFHGPKKSQAYYTHQKDATKDAQSVSAGPVAAQAAVTASKQASAQPQTLDPSSPPPLQRSTGRPSPPKRTADTSEITAPVDLARAFIERVSTYRLRMEELERYLRYLFPGYASFNIQLSANNRFWVFKVPRALTRDEKAEIHNNLRESYDF
ncbi:hypothetical protein B0H66DRAFT_547158 [Apodospora peruviana]|uniref:Uncharacterized protein n=1 Tax=Apodospora peruviana TaxID=516989 RepID=A0AAE0IGY6_9PEZI|nr:hypothetical protein B0H66DRAFT_547158 [Apodospora peruviana]